MWHIVNDKNTIPIWQVVNPEKSQPPEGG